MKKLSILALAFMATFALASCNRQEIDPPQGGVQGKYLLTEITAYTGEDDTKTAIQSNSVVNWSANDQIAVKGTDGALHYYILKYGSGTPVGRFLPATGQTPVSYNSLSDLTAIYPACAAELSGGELYVNINNQDLSGSFTEKGLTTWTSDSPFTFTNNDIKVAVPGGTTRDDNGKINFKFKQLGTCCGFVIDFRQAEQAASLMLESVERIQVTTLEGVALGGRAKLTGTSLGPITNPLTNIDWTLATLRPMTALIQPTFVFFPEATTNTTLKITLTTTDHEFVFTGKPTQNFEAGHRLTFPITVDKNCTVGGTTLAYTSSVRTDVDQFYYYGGTNCLLLRAANEVGYLDVTQYVTDSHWHNTKNAVDVQNPRPASYAKIIWSEGADVIASATVDESADYKLKMAGSAPGAVDAISTDGSGMSFLAIQRGSVPGNALVGIYDASDNLLWSYHIWCPQDDPTSAMYEYTQTNSGTYTVMTMPIGAIKRAYPGMSNPETAAGFYYQWGRKDPLGRPTSFSSRNGGDLLLVKGPDQSTDLDIGDTDYSIEGGNLNACEIWLAKNGGTDNENKLLNAANAVSATKSLGRFMLEYTISKPWMFILVDGLNSGNWTSRDDYLWGNGYTSQTFPIMEDTYKSIFDPSPERFRVAPQDLWCGFNNTGTYLTGPEPGEALELFKEQHYNVFTKQYSFDNMANGYSFYYQGWRNGPTDFYIASGFREGGLGTIAGVSYSGAFWCSSCYGTEGSGGRFYATERVVGPNAWSSRAIGCNIRCVKEY